MDSADVLRQALGWGLWALLEGAAEWRALHATCRALRAAVTQLIDTLALPLDGATCSVPATPHAMAAFHRRCPAATHLCVHVSLDEGRGAVELAASRFMAAYASSQGGLPSVTHCTIRVHEERDRKCMLYLAPFTSLLLALPRLEDVSILYWLAPGALMVKLLRALARCERLHTLALSAGCCWHELYVVQAVARRLPRLRALSLDTQLQEAHLAALRPLTQLERLGVQDLYDVGASPEMPSVRTLCQPWRGGGAGSGHGGPGHAMDNTTGLDVGSLHPFPGLQRLEGFNLYCNSLIDRAHWPQRLALFPPAVRRLARCAEHWGLSMDLSQCRALPEGTMQQHLPPGSLAALRNMCISEVDDDEDEDGDGDKDWDEDEDGDGDENWDEDWDEDEDEDAANGAAPVVQAHAGPAWPHAAVLVQLLEAAPALTGLTYHVDMPMTVATLATWRAVLRPLKRLACLQQLQLGPEQPVDDLHAGALAALVRYLLAPEAEGGDCCRALARVVVVCDESLVGSFEVAAAASAAAAGAMLRAEGIAVQLGVVCA